MGAMRCDAMRCDAMRCDATRYLRVVQLLGESAERELLGRGAERRWIVTTKDAGYLGSMGPRRVMGGVVL